MTERDIPETAMRLDAMIVVRRIVFAIALRILLYAHMVRLPSWQDLYFDDALAREMVCVGCFTIATRP